MNVLVACHSGHEYAERPTALTWQGQSLKVEAVLARWRAPGEKWFRVRTTDGQFFELTYDEVADEWRIQQP
ncbi:MAG: hypothetical protein JXB85_12325 [Anaerolineales bacterium]|nr:hypothetical protein [Anaerolineales bacterium]